MSYPIYIPSKGRHEYMMTSKTLTAMGIGHYIIAEPEEIDAYRAAVKKWGLSAEVLELDMRLKNSYELCDNLGLSKSTGSGPARNFAREQSDAIGAARHWVVDDNISSFYRLHENKKIRVAASSFFEPMEEFCDRYENIAMAGPAYEHFAPRRQKSQPFTMNTRLFSCNLINNKAPFRWRGRYNEDIILSIDMLKAGWCTVQFNAFLQDKSTTQTMRGGNSSELYKKNGFVIIDGKKADASTLAKSEMLCRLHPDVARLAVRYGRVHHYADMSRFRSNKLIRINGRENIDMSSKMSKIITV